MISCLLELENMILVMKNARRKKGLSSLLKLRKVLLIDLLLNKVKLVEKIKLFKQTLTKIMVSDFNEYDDK